jgi:hypothetical protein
MEGKLWVRTWGKNILCVQQTIASQAQHVARMLFGAQGLCAMEGRQVRQLTLQGSSGCMLALVTYHAYAGKAACCITPAPLEQ